MRRTLIAALATMAVAGPAVMSTAYAQDAQTTAPATTQQATPAPGHQEHHRRPRMSAEDRAALTDARIASLKAGLKLTADQEKQWPALETALRDLAKERADRMAKMREDRRNGERPNAIERLRMRADRMDQGAADLKKIADAAEPLYNSLDAAQKRRFTMLTRNTFGGQPMMMRRMAREHGPNRG
jgi:hypothetical protein